MSTDVETQRAPSRRKSTVDKEERLVELWAEQPCLFDVNCHSYHDRVEKEKRDAVLRVHMTRASLRDIHTHTTNPTSV